MKFWITSWLVLGLVIALVTTSIDGRLNTPGWSRARRFAFVLIAVLLWPLVLVDRHPFQ